MKKIAIVIFDDFTDIGQSDIYERLITLSIQEGIKVNKEVHEFNMGV